MLRAITNWTCRTLGVARRGPDSVIVRVGVSYRCDPDQVRDVLAAAARQCPLILQDPAPSVGFDNFGASALEFSLTAFLPDARRSGAVETDLRTRILKAFRAAGIEMPHAQHDVHLRDLDGLRTFLLRIAQERTRQE